MADDGIDRAEQKRQRERQRRSALAKAFEELKQLLNEVDESDVVEVDEITARVETVRRANSALRRLIAENDILKRNLAAMQSATSFPAANAATADSSNTFYPTSAPIPMAKDAAGELDVFHPGLPYAMTFHAAPLPRIRHENQHEMAATAAQSMYTGETSGTTAYPLTTTSIGSSTLPKVRSQPTFPTDTLSIQSILSVAHGLDQPYTGAWPPAAVAAQATLAHGHALDASVSAARPEFDSEFNALPGPDQWKPELETLHDTFLDDNLPPPGAPIHRSSRTKQTFPFPDQSSHT